MVRKEFRVHMLNSEGKAKANWLAQTFSDALDVIEHIAGKDGRDMALVRTKLEEASFYAKRAIAARPESQEPASAESAAT